MNELLNHLIAISPLFIMIFFEKIIDSISYQRKLREKGKSKIIIPYMFIIVGALLVLQLLSAALENWLCNSEVMRYGDTWGLLFALFGLPVLAVLLLIILYLIERKRINICLQETSLTKRSFITNLILTCGYSVSNVCFLTWWISSYLGEITFMFGANNSEINAKWLMIQRVGVISIIAVFTLIKFISQKMIEKRITV